MNKFNKFLTVLSGVLIIGTPCLAAGNASSPNFTIDIAQHIAIATTTHQAETNIDSSTNGVANGIVNAVWTVTTNNGFNMTFSGTHTADAGTADQATPKFTKLDADSDAAAVSNGVVDNLDTTFASKITSYQSIETGHDDEWSAISNPAGTGAQLVSAVDAAGGPGIEHGRIMNSDGGDTIITLYAKAVSDAHDQSGRYSMVVGAIATGDEVGG